MSNLSIYRPLTKEIFNQDIINSSLPVVLVFGAKWSGTAEMMHSIAERVAKNQKENIGFYKVDIEEQQEIATFFGITKVPTVILIRQGEIVHKITGLLSASKLRKYIQETYSENSASQQ